MFSVRFTIIVLSHLEHRVKNIKYLTCECCFRSYAWYKARSYSLCVLRFRVTRFIWGSHHILDGTANAMLSINGSNGNIFTPRSILTSRRHYSSSAWKSKIKRISPTLLRKLERANRSECRKNKPDGAKK